MKNMSDPKTFKEIREQYRREREVAKQKLKNDMRAINEEFKQSIKSGSSPEGIKREQDIIDKMFALLPWWVHTILFLVFVLGWTGGSGFWRSLGVVMLLGATITLIVIGIKRKKLESEVKKSGRIFASVLLAISFIILNVATPKVDIDDIDSMANITDVDQEKIEEQEEKETEERDLAELRESLAQDVDYKQGEHVKVTRVVDGDTIHTDKYKIRIIGLDAPETNHSNKSMQCFSKEATAEMKRLVGDEMVYLRPDPSQSSTDKYGRYLFYVYLEDGRNVAYEMIKQGFAHEYTYNSNPHKWQKQFKEAQKHASDNNLGLWAKNACKDDTKKVADSKKATKVSQRQRSTSSSTPAKKSTSAPASQKKSACNIKGNINRKGEKIYHVPGGAYYNKTVIDESAGERWFCSEAEAQQAGWRRSKR